MVAVPATSPDVRVEVATPFVVVLVMELEPRLPRSVVKVTTVPSATGFPNSSSTVAVMVEVSPPTGMLVG
jgi:hypothetical protein